MKAQLLIASALLAAPLCQAVETVPYSDETADAMEAAVMQQCLSDYTRCSASLCELIESIHDPASAVAVLPKIQSRLELIQHLQFGINYLPQEEIEKAFSAAGITAERLEKARRQLVENQFYGSIGLAKSVGYPISSMLEPGEVTPELLQELGAELKAKLGNQLNNISGGPGFTEETAWRLGKQPENLQYIAIIMDSFPDAEKDDQTMLHTEEGPIYGRMSFVLPYRGKAYRLQMWFDITEIMKAEENAPAQDEKPVEVTEYDDSETINEDEAVTIELPQEDLPQPDPIRIYNDEEKKAIIQQYAAMIKETGEVFAQILDRESADAAAVKISDILKKSADMPTDFSLISSMDVLEELEKNQVNTKMIQEHGQRIEKANFYGSETLKRAMLHR